MTASFSGSAAVTASMNVPPTQNTAPVLEFRCLFTHDLRRKQKRWQDGRLKFHTFNKRVMVYDEKFNFVGDTHWREDSELVEGEELELERLGTLIEVGECVGTRDQDLTELLDRRVKEREERAAAKAASPAVFKSQGTPTSNALRGKTLNTLVIPTGHYGRAVVPGTSPFEERQGIAGVQEKDGQERPAKRRKPNEIASSKNGYAQNLMGATLNLSSSRPPSTGPIRYEPLGVTPSLPVRSEHIDLTGEGSNDSDQDVVDRTRGVIETAKPSKLQRKAKRSPPANSGYASNLTGAALTLSRPENIGKIRPSQPPASRPAVASNLRTQETFSEDEGSFHEIIASKKLPASKATKAKELSKPQMSRAPSVSQSRGEKASASEKTTRNPKPFIESSSGFDPTPERPMSALRIKARSGPKMMMLMNRPGSRANASAESSGIRRTKSVPVQQTRKSSNDIVLSQATMELNAFCQKQHDRLQARLEGQRRPTILDLDLDDLSSSLIDSGIDHGTIDRLLSRRTRPAEKDSETSSTLDDAHDMPVGGNSSKERPQLVGEEQRERKDLSAISSNLSSPFNGTESLSADLPPESPNPPLKISGNDISQAAMTPSPSGDGSKSDGLALHSNPVHDPGPLPGIPPPVQTVTNRSGLEALERLEGRPKPLPRQVSGDIEDVQEHSCTGLKSPASQQHELAALPPVPPDKERRAEGVRPPPEHQEPNPRVLPLKTFGELLQPPEKELANSPRLPDNNVLGTDTAGKAPTVPAVQTMPPPRRLLINPATRGKSVQTLAANTNDTLNNPTPTTMSTRGPPPPPPRLPSRTDPIIGRNDVARGLDRGAAAKEASDADGGPWSRDAFDLFAPKMCERIMELRTTRANG